MTAPIARLHRFAAAISTLAFIAVPALAENSYGGHDIAGGEYYLEFYGAARGWNVFAGSEHGKFAYCYAEKDRGDGNSVRFGFDNMQWQLAVPVDSNPDWEGTLQIDGQGSGQGYGSGGDYISGTAVPGWTIAWLGMPELDGLQQGSQALLGIGKADFDFGLEGAAAASLKVQECVERGGAPTSAAASAPSPSPAPTPSPAPSPNPSPSTMAALEPTESSISLYGQAGSWVVEQTVDTGRVVACDAYDARNPNLRLEINVEYVYIDFRDNGSMDDLGNSSAALVEFDHNNAPVDATAEVIEGRDGQKWARITQNRADGPGLIDDYFPNAQNVVMRTHAITMETDLRGSNKGIDLLLTCSNQIQ